MSGNINNIPLAYQQLMYQHFIAIQQFFFTHWFFFFVTCSTPTCYQEREVHVNSFHILWDILLAWTHTLISNCIKLNCRYMLRITECFSQWFKNSLWVQISVSYSLSQINWVIQIFFWPAAHSKRRKAGRQWSASAVAYLGVNPNRVLMFSRLQNRCQLHYSNFRHLAYQILLTKQVEMNIE